MAKGLKDFLVQHLFVSAHSGSFAEFLIQPLIMSIAWQGPTVAVSLAAGVYVCLHNGLLVMYFYWLYTDLYPVYYGLS